MLISEKIKRKHNSVNLWKKVCYNFSSNIENDSKMILYCTFTYISIFIPKTGFCNPPVATGQQHIYINNDYYYLKYCYLLAFFFLVHVFLSQKKCMYYFSAFFQNALK